ncbi:MAG: hypothetical protein HYT08_04460 [Candidatus Levybacteria bacterium]|nr:hypothetical protein [Candidatus Levybacteria bacterium]
MRKPEEIIRSLFDRGAEAYEIAEITDYSGLFIEQTIKKLGGNTGKKSGILKFPVKKWVPEGSGKRGIEITRKIIAEELLSESLWDWDNMVALYEKHGRFLSARFSDRLRLEVFLTGIRNAKKGEPAVLSRLMEIESSLPSYLSDASLEKEKDFIGENFVEDPVGVKRDEIGYFREDEDGRWREPVVSGQQGGIIVDSPNEALRREISRSITASSSKKERK